VGEPWRKASAWRGDVLAVEGLVEDKFLGFFLLWVLMDYIQQEIK
jgi:hypothetical protein